MNPGIHDRLGPACSCSRGPRARRPEIGAFPHFAYLRGAFHSADGMGLSLAPGGGLAPTGVQAPRIGVTTVHLGDCDYLVVLNVWFNKGGSVGNPSQGKCTEAQYGLALKRFISALSLWQTQDFYECCSAASGKKGCRLKFGLAIHKSSSAQPGIPGPVKVRFYCGDKGRLKRFPPNTKEKDFVGSTSVSTGDMVVPAADYDSKSLKGQPRVDSELAIAHEMGHGFGMVPLTVTGFFDMISGTPWGPTRIDGHGGFGALLPPGLMNPSMNSQADGLIRSAYICQIAKANGLCDLAECCTHPILEYPIDSSKTTQLSRSIRDGVLVSRHAGNKS